MATEDLTGTFRQLLAREVGAARDASAITAAACRLCDRMGRELAPVIGDAGMAAIYDRAVHLALRQFSEIAPGGFDRHDPVSAKLRRTLAHQDPHVATEAAIVVLVTIAELLASFIGTSLTIRLLHVCWPDEFAIDGGSRRSERE